MLSDDFIYEKLMKECGFCHKKRIQLVELSRVQDTKQICYDCIERIANGEPIDKIGE